jgi:hypothetical protein
MRRFDEGCNARAYGSESAQLMTELDELAAQRVELARIAKLWREARPCPAVHGHFPELVERERDNPAADQPLSAASQPHMIPRQSVIVLAPTPRAAYLARRAGQ